MTVTAPHLTCANIIAAVLALFAAATGQAQDMPRGKEAREKLLREQAHLLRQVDEAGAKAPDKTLALLTQARKMENALFPFPTHGELFLIGALWDLPERRKTAADLVVDAATLEASFFGFR